MHFLDAMTSASIDGYRYVKKLATGEVHHLGPVLSRRRFPMEDTPLWQEEPGPRVASLGPRWFTDRDGKRLFVCTMEKE